MDPSSPQHVIAGALHPGGRARPEANRRNRRESSTGSDRVGWRVENFVPPASIGHRGHELKRARHTLLRGEDPTGSPSLPRFAFSRPHHADDPKETAPIGRHTPTPSRHMRVQMRDLWQLLLRKPPHFADSTKTALEDTDRKLRYLFRNVAGRRRGLAGGYSQYPEKSHPGRQKRS